MDAATKQQIRHRMESSVDDLHELEKASLRQVTSWVNRGFFSQYQRFNLAKAKRQHNRKKRWNWINRWHSQVDEVCDQLTDQLPIGLSEPWVHLQFVLDRGAKAANWMEDRVDEEVFGRWWKALNQNREQADSLLKWFAQEIDGQHAKALQSLKEQMGRRMPLSDEEYAALARDITAEVRRGDR